MKKEYLIKIGMLQQEAERLTQENNAVSKQIIELEELKLNLKEFSERKNNNALISLGKGIFTKAELKDRELYVNIGEGVVIKKSVQDTIEIINRQIEKLEKFKESLLQEMEKLNLQVKEVVENGKENNNKG